MKYDLLTDAIIHIVSSLNNNKEISSQISGVYTYVPSDAGITYIYINKISSKNSSTKTFKGLEIDACISAVTKESTMFNILKLSDKICSALTFNNISLDGGSISSLLLSKNAILKSQNQSFQIQNNFKFYVKEVN